MLGSEAVDFLKPRLFLLCLLAGANKYFFGSYTSLPGVFLSVVFVTYIISAEKVTARTPSPPVPTPTSRPDDGRNELSKVVGALTDPKDEITQLLKALDRLEVLLQRYADWIESTGTACLESLRQIFKQQRDQLRQYTELRNVYDEKLGSIVNVLDDHRDGIAETSRAAAENTTALCNNLGQYRQDIENNQTLVQQHVVSVDTILANQERAISAVRQHVTERTDTFEARLEGHARTAEENKKLVKEYGTSVNRVVSDHTQLVAEYQVALEGMVSLTTANRVFSLVHTPYGWETLGDVAEDLEDRKVPRSGAQPAAGSLIDNVQELSRTFRATSNQTAKATPSLMDQMMAGIFSKIQDTVQATVTAQSAEGMGQLRKAQEDIEKLQADLGEIEEFRRAIREREELEKEHKELEKRYKRNLEIVEILKNDPQRIHRDSELRAEVDETTRWADKRKRAAGASSPGKAAKAAAV